ncbi:MAG: hypothetical protein ACON5A_03760 [Candidatus Comchoanobacterales bacterium]
MIFTFVTLITLGSISALITLDSWIHSIPLVDDDILKIASKHQLSYADLMSMTKPEKNLSLNITALKEILIIKPTKYIDIFKKLEIKDQKQILMQHPEIFLAACDENIQLPAFSDEEILELTSCWGKIKSKKEIKNDSPFITFFGNRPEHHFPSYDNYRFAYVLMTKFQYQLMNNKGKLLLKATKNFGYLSLAFCENSQLSIELPNIYQLVRTNILSNTFHNNPALLFRPICSTHPELTFEGRITRKYKYQVANFGLEQACVFAIISRAMIKSNNPKETYKHIQASVNFTKSDSKPLDYYKSWTLFDKYPTLFDEDAPIYQTLKEIPQFHNRKTTYQEAVMVATSIQQKIEDNGKTLDDYAKGHQSGDKFEHFLALRKKPENSLKSLKQHISILHQELSNIITTKNILDAHHSLFVSSFSLKCGHGEHKREFTEKPAYHIMEYLELYDIASYDIAFNNRSHT